MGLFDKLGGARENTFMTQGCNTLPSLPGYDVVESLGIVEYVIKNVAGDITKRETSVFQKLLETAKKSGANAVVNARIMTGSYEAQGPKWQVTYVIAYGDAVVVKKLTCSP